MNFLGRGKKVLEEHGEQEEVGGGIPPVDDRSHIPEERRLAGRFDL